MRGAVKPEAGLRSAAGGWGVVRENWRKGRGHTFGIEGAGPGVTCGGFGPAAEERAGLVGKGWGLWKGGVVSEKGWVN